MILGDNSNASTPGSADGGDGCNDDDPASKKKSTKRVIFTKAASNVFRVWLFKNLTVGQCSHLNPFCRFWLNRN